MAKFKKLLAVVITLAMVLSLANVTALAAGREQTYGASGIASSRTVTIKVGEKGTYTYSTPVLDFNCPYNKNLIIHSAHIYQYGEAYGDYDDSILGNVDCGYNRNGYDIDIWFTGLKPGTTTFTFKTSVYFGNCGNHYCSYCRQNHRCADYNWYDRTITFTVVVEGSEETDPNPQNGFTLTYHSNDGSNRSEKVTVDPKTEYVSLADGGTMFPRDGYKFLGWGLTSGTDRVEYNVSWPLHITGNKDLYAVWEKEPEKVPEAPTLDDASKYIEIKVKCDTKETEHPIETYDLLEGSYSATAPEKVSDGVWKSTVTIQRQPYIDAYSKNHGLHESMIRETAKTHILYWKDGQWHADSNFGSSKVTYTFEVKCVETKPTLPELSVTKSLITDVKDLKVGDDLIWSIVITGVDTEGTDKLYVTDNGVTLYSDLDCTEPLEKDETAYYVEATSETVTVYAKRAVTEADLGNTVTNEATAKQGDRSASGSNTSGQLPTAKSELQVIKTITSTPADGKAYAAGETITYQITVTNNGNVTLTDITVTDPLTDGNWTIDSLAPGESQTFTTSYKVQQSDLGENITNTATASVTGGPSASGSVNAAVQARDPKLEVTKTVTSKPANGEAYAAGETITYEITVTNNGNVDLTGITVRDIFDGTGKLTWTDEDPTTAFNLAAGATKTFTATYTVLEDDLGGTITNTATASGMDGNTTVDSTTPTEGGNETYAPTVEREIKITVTFEDGQGKTLETYKDVPVRDDGDYTDLYEGDDPARDGFTFTGWGEPETDNDGNVTYEAQWAEDENGNGTPDDEEDRITVTFEDGQGNTLDEHENVLPRTDGDYTDLYEGEEPTRDGYIFTGWDEPAIDEDGNVTYTAQWTEDENGNGTPDDEEGKITVTFEDGQGNMLQEYENVLPRTDGDYTDLYEGEDPARDGYTFTGWEKTVDETTGDVTYTAQWTENSTDPGTGGETDPGTGGETDPGTGGETDPGTGGETDPGTGGETDPGTGGETDPGTGGETDPGTGGETDPGTGGETDPGTGGETDPGTGGETDPGTGGETDPGTGGETDPGTGGETDPGTDEPGTDEPGTDEPGTDTPDTPDEPDTPDTPDVPDTPDEPDEPDDPVIDIPDEDPPVADEPTDEPDEPVVDIPDEEPPLADEPTDEPDDEPTVEIPDEEPPLSDVPAGDDTTEILDEDVPLDSLPETGDSREDLVWAALALMSAIGLCGAALALRKKED